MRDALPRCSLAESPPPPLAAQVESQRRYCRYFAENLGMSRPLRELVITSINIIDMPPGYSQVGVTLRGAAFCRRGVLQRCQEQTKQDERTG